MKQEWEKIRDSRTFDEVYFLAIALLLAFGALQFTGTAMNTDRPVVSVVSCSMYPKLHVGDILFVQGREFSEIQEGDVIVYSTEEIEIPVVHRVIEKNEDYLETKGDNNPSQIEFEKNVTADQVHGSYLFKIPRVGVLKLLVMDLTGVGASNTEYRNQFLTLENSYSCQKHVPMSQRPYS